MNALKVLTLAACMMGIASLALPPLCIRGRVWGNLYTSLVQAAKILQLQSDCWIR